MKDGVFRPFFVVQDKLNSDTRIRWPADLGWMRGIANEISRILRQFWALSNNTNAIIQ